MSGLGFMMVWISLSGIDGYRRNNYVDVINYEFSVTVNDTNNIIYGKSAVSLKFTGLVRNLDLDLKNLKPDGKGMIVDSIYFIDGGIKWEHKGNKIIISFDEALNEGSDGVVNIIYHGIPSDGLIISNNKFKNRTFFSDHWPDRASNYLPCIDHPYDKATVDFIIITPDHYQVVASGYLVEESLLAGNTKLTHWKEAVPLATKVMAFGAAEFDILLAGKPDNIPVWTWVFKENRKEGFYDYSYAVKPFVFFGQLIGDYPYEKLANVQSKTIFGGLENAGCIFYAENSVTGQGKVEGLLAHEIAHQWFGNSVTENDWHHVWLSEGFATYLTSVYQEMTYGKEQLTENMKSARERVIKSYLRSPGPVIDTTITDLMKLLSPNSYQKGAWILHMLRRELGEDQFWQGMRLYYGRFRNKNAMTNDFKNVMEEVSRKDLNTFFHQWLYIPGQPDLKIVSHPSQKKGVTDIVIEQQQKNLFTFPLEILFRDQEGSHIEKVQISEKVTILTLKAAKLTELIPDPNVNLLFRLIPN